MRKFFLLLIASMFVVAAGRPALGFLEFHKEWVKMYVDEEDESKKNQEFVKVVTGGRTKCLVCHQGKKRTHHNPYGIHFVGPLTKEDKKDTDKIIKMLKEVGAMPVDPEADPEDENTVTYEMLIARHELPGGTLKELQKEPPKEEEEGENEDKEGDSAGQ